VGAGLGELCEFREAIKKQQIRSSQMVFPYLTGEDLYCVYGADLPA
jgi:hypothetical protein